MKAGDLIAALARRRVALGMPQVEVAEIVGVRAHTVGDWEAGKHMPGVRELLAWIDAVDLELVLRERVGRRPEHDERPPRQPSGQRGGLA